MIYWRSLEGRFEPSTCYQAAIDARETNEGGTLGVVVLLINIANFFKNMALYQSALLFVERALAIWEKVLGPDHPDVAASLNNPASLYDSKGKYAEAEPLHRRAMAIWEKALGSDHPSVATSQNNLAGLYYS